MTRAKLLSLVKHWQNFLGLDHWQIEVDFDTPADEGRDAVIWRQNQFDQAILYLEEDWRAWTPLKANQLIVHELLHLVTRDLDEAHSSVGEVVHHQAWAVLQHRFEHELEGVIDRLALLLVELAHS